MINHHSIRYRLLKSTSGSLRVPNREREQRRREFIDRQQPKYKHIIVEGDRFFRSVDLEWIVENHDTKVFVLTVDSDEEKRRHVERNDTQSEVWLSGRRSQISNILTNFNLMGKIEVRQNNSFESSQKIKGEIMEILNGEIHGKV